MRILVIGDIFGRPGRVAVQRVLPQLRADRGIDFVVANGENAAGGRGMSLATLRPLFTAGVDVITSGNHVWDQRAMLEEIETEPRILRPLNLPPGVPGRGYWSDGRVLVANAMGRLFMRAIDCPFRGLDALLARQPLPPVRIVDFHADATSEKTAMGWHLAGRVSVVFGTHSHVPTADARLLPGGTAYVSDVGMTGPRDSVIGLDPQRAIAGFITGLPSRLQVARGPAVFRALLVDVDASTGQAQRVERVEDVVEITGDTEE
ncbi:MAG: YmdB family metallophosphoesterase [Chloroflexi bacterium]|nr:YmdB family metallophosphoesterase [Chloroflexota bacterium]